MVLDARLFSLGGIGIAVGMCSSSSSGKRDEKSKLLPAQLHELAEGKFYMDEMYLDGFVAGANRVSDACSGADASGVDGLVNAAGRAGLFVGDVSGDLDETVVDGAVLLTADVAHGAGAAGAAAQNGRVRNYLAMAIGATAVVVVVLLLTIG